MEPLPSTPSPSPSPPQEPAPTTVEQKRKVKPSTPPNEAEAVSISQTSQEINQYTEAMADLPIIRQERITEIQAALKKGTYSVSSEDLADKLIQEISNQEPDPSSSSS